jgi:molecular chaperone HscB
VAVANLSGFDNYFALFDLTPAFKIQREALEAAYLAVQKEVHPDKHASASDAQKRASMQMATLVNTAYRTLKQPISRGLYLCDLHGIDPQLETNTAMPTEFLMQQMAWREALEEAGSDTTQLEILYKEVNEARTRLLHQVEETMDVAHNYTEAAKHLRALLFVEKFTEELEEAMAA